MTFLATKAKVSNRGVPPDEFIAELVTYGEVMPIELYAPNTNPADIFASVKGVLGGSYKSLGYRRGVLLESLRVLAGFESSWNWNEGVDISAKDRSNPKTQECGAWQVSMDSLPWGQDLRDLTQSIIGTIDYHSADKFQAAMKSNHQFAMEYIARLLRHTCLDNGPVLRHEIDPWLRVDAVVEFETLLANAATY